MDKDSNSQNGSPFGSVWVQSLTLFRIPSSVNVIFGLHFQPAPFHALILVVSPRLGWRKKMMLPTLSLKCSNVFTSFVFIELFNSSSSDDLTTLVLLTKSPKSILQLATWLSPQPFDPMGSIQSIIFCLCVMVLLGHLTSCKIWIMIRFLFKKSNSYRLHLMGMSCLNYH